MINLCNLHRLINLTHPELHSILNRSHLSDLKEDYTFKETIILDKKPGKTKDSESTSIFTVNSSTVRHTGSSKSSGNKSESTLSQDLDSINTVDTSSSSIVNTTILGGESMVDVKSVPSYKFSPRVPDNSIDPFFDTGVIITDHLFRVPKNNKLRQSKSKGTKISLPSHQEDDQSYEIQHIILSQTEINVPPKISTPNRFVRFWRRLFKK